jgi:hypothetical protein
MRSNPDHYAIPRGPVFEGFGARTTAAPLPSLLDRPHRILTRSGRSALVLALEAGGVQAGDGVLVPAYHCPTMVAPVERVGAVPRFYPLDGDGMPDLEALLRHPLRPCRAMIVAHLFGLPRRLDAVAAFCRAHGIVLIEDCAHALFGTAGEVAVGQTGDFAIGSLTKFYPVTGGGVLVAPAPEPLDRLRRAGLVGGAGGPLAQLRAAWDVLQQSARYRRLPLMKGDPREPPIASQPPPEVLPEETRRSALADPLLVPESLRWVDAWLLRALDPGAIIVRRQLNYAAICAAVADLPAVTVLMPHCPATAAPYVVPLLLQEPDRQYARLRAAGLPVFRWDRIWPGTPSCPGDSSALWKRHLVQVACHQSIGETGLAVIVRCLREILAGAAAA